jgi:hypothetical protein
MSDLYNFSIIRHNSYGAGIVWPTEGSLKDAKEVFIGAARESGKSPSVDKFVREVEEIAEGRFAWDGHVNHLWCRVWRVSK